MNWQPIEAGIDIALARKRLNSLGVAMWFDAPARLFKLRLIGDSDNKRYGCETLDFAIRRSIWLSTGEHET